MVNFRNKPLHLLNETECQRFNAEVREGEKPVLYAESTTKKGKTYPLYDRSDIVKGLPIYKRKIECPLGHIPKSTATNYGIEIKPDEKPVGIVLGLYDKGLTPVYDKSEDPNFLIWKKTIVKFREAILEDGLPAFQSKTLPKHFSPSDRMSGYYLDPAKKPVGVKISKRDRYCYVYDMSDEMDKSHYQMYGNKPDGFLTLKELEEQKIALEEKEKPAAYGTVGKMVTPLYDKTSHPKYRIRLLVNGKSRIQ